MTKKDFEVRKHVLVPKHIKISEKEKKVVLDKYKISVYDLPLIYKKDPANAGLDVQSGDMIKIIRKSPTAGEAVFYRCVIDG